MDKLSRIWAIVLATGVVWACVAVTRLIGDSDFVFGIAAILALIGTITIWSMWALDYYGISVDESGTTSAERAAVVEKAKRGTEEDARLALMLSLMTPDERDTLRARLEEDLAADGEVVSLAGLLAEQQAQAERHA